MSGEEQNIIDFYTHFIDKYHPTSSMAVGWSTKEKQNLIHFELLRELLKNVNDRDYTILDVGCGVGALSDKVLGEYTGIDMHPRMIEEAKKLYPDKTFINKSLEQYNVKHDYGVCAGSFNYLGDGKDKPYYIIEELYKVLNQMGDLCRKGFSISYNVDIEGDYYVNSIRRTFINSELIRYCFYHFKRCTFRADYLDDDFMITVFK